MKKFLAVLILLSITSCYQSKNTSNKAIYSLPIKVDGKASKEGKSCKNYVFLISNLFSSYDISVETARLKGGITEITSIDEETTTFIPLFQRTCTIVKGN